MDYGLGHNEGRRLRLSGAGAVLGQNIKSKKTMRFAAGSEAEGLTGKGVATDTYRP